MSHSVLGVDSEPFRWRPQRQHDAGVSSFVRDFADGDRSQADLLGGKGANLAEMTGLGLPVPPGFTITTEACRAYLSDGTTPAGSTPS